jgi:hypothetical protein
MGDHVSIPHDLPGLRRNPPMAYCEKRGVGSVVSPRPPQNMANMVLLGGDLPKLDVMQEDASVWLDIIRSGWGKVLCGGQAWGA